MRPSSLTAVGVIRWQLMGSGDGGGLGSSCSGKLAPGWAALAPLCWDHVGTVPRAQRASPAMLPPAWGRAWELCSWASCPALGSDVIRPWSLGWVGNIPAGVRRTQRPESVPAAGGARPRALRSLAVPEGPVLPACTRSICVLLQAWAKRPHSRWLAGHFPRASPCHPAARSAAQGACRGRRPGAARSSACCFSPTPSPPQGQGTES